MEKVKEKQNGLPNAIAQESSVNFLYDATAVYVIGIDLNSIPTDITTLTTHYHLPHYVYKFQANDASIDMGSLHIGTIDLEYQKNYWFAIYVFGKYAANYEVSYMDVSFTTTTGETIVNQNIIANNGDDKGKLWFCLNPKTDINAGTEAHMVMKPTFSLRDTDSHTFRVKIDPIIKVGDSGNVIP